MRNGYTKDRYTKPPVSHETLINGSHLSLRLDSYSIKDSMLFYCTNRATHMEKNMLLDDSSKIKVEQGDDHFDSLRRKALDDVYKLKLNFRGKSWKGTKTVVAGKDLKTVRGEKYGVLTGILYLAPANVSGIETCKGRTKGCTASCLFTANNGSYSSVQYGRIRKTYALFLRTDEFMRQLQHDILVLQNRADELNKILAIRLNGTSDILWENISFTGNNNVVYSNIFEAFPTVQFYDYTKIYTRLESTASIENYTLTFSRAETKLSAIQTMKALENGHSATVVFYLGKNDKLPEKWNGYTVVDGDLNDIRFWDKNVIVGLKAKHMAKTDNTGFVVRLNKANDNVPKCSI